MRFKNKQEKQAKADISFLETLKKVCKCKDPLAYSTPCSQNKDRDFRVKCTPFPKMNLETGLKFN